MILTIDRIKENKQQTLGELKLIDNEGVTIFQCKTLELPWKNNKEFVSRIPEGGYTGLLHHSPKFGNCIWLQDVPDRTEILIHIGNYNDDTTGCILVGDSFKDISHDGLLDVKNSGKTMDKLMSHVKDCSEVYISILNKF